MVSLSSTVAVAFLSVFLGAFLPARETQGLGGGDAAMAYAGVRWRSRGWLGGGAGPAVALADLALVAWRQ